MFRSIFRPYVAVKFVLIALVLLLTSFSSSVLSQIPENAVSIAVSPQILDITANPGESIDNTFRLTNASNESIVVAATPKNFRPTGEQGAVDITTDDTNFSLASWVTVTPETVTIPSGTTQDFSVNISVPDEVEPGSHYGSVVFSTIPPEQEGSGALVSQEIAPVILVKVAGETIETIQIEEFKTANSFYSNQNSIELISRLKNTGTVHFKPTGVITIKNMFGNEVAKLDLDQKNVLPETIRQFTNNWELEGFNLGRYTATLTVVYGENNEISTSEYSFMIFPYQTIVPVVLLVTLIIVVIVKFRKRIAKAFRVLSGKDEDNKE